MTTGDKSPAATTGDKSPAATTGNWSPAATAGDKSPAATTGYRSPAATTGDWSPAATTGNKSPAATTGYESPAATTGNWSPAATTGNRSPAATTGDWSPAATTGYRSPAATTGNWSPAATTGDWSPAATLGAGGWARSNVAVCIAEYKRGGVVRLHVAHVGEDGFIAGRWACVSEGKIVQPPDVLDIDKRGYVLRYSDGRYTAGCRDFNAAEALAHWSDPDHCAPESAAILYAAVLANEELIRKGTE